ncbi:MAG TPA: peptidylprolyl isomerase [Vicinamibacterales bacterium]|nr:peptidylprolyl isomerase [Vicinamibacterales bacterium]
MPIGLILLALTASLAIQKPAPKPSPGAGPVIVMETVKGTIEFETYPEDAPKTVEHILNLVRRGFYNGLRVHRAGDMVVQLGDPQTRDMTKRDLWGRGPAAGSGKPIGVAEISKRRTHRRGAVGMAHAGDPRLADSQFYIMRRAERSLDGKYAVFGQVVSGMDVVDRLEVTDIVRRAYVKGEKKP